MVPVPSLRRVPRPSVRLSTAAATGALLLVAVAFLYDFLGPGVETLPPDFEPRRIDWLLALSLVLLAWYSTARFVRNPGGAWRFLVRLSRRPGALLAALFLVGLALFGLVGPLVVGDPSPTLDAKLQPPVYATSDSPNTINCVGQKADGNCAGTWAYPLGTDKIGRDMVTLLAHGARTTLVVALVTGTLIVPIAVGVGVGAAYLGGRVDQVLMRYVDVQQTIPAFLVYLILRFLYGSSMFLFVLVFGFLSWGGVARIVRSDAIRYRSSTQIDAARGVGAGHLHVLRRYFLPKVSPIVIAGTSRELPTLVLAQAALAFLDLHDVLVPSWGRTIANGISESPNVLWSEWWLWLLPTLALALTVVALNVFGNTLYELLDPTATEWTGK